MSELQETQNSDDLNSSKEESKIISDYSQDVPPKMMIKAVLESLAINSTQNSNLLDLNNLDSDQKNKLLEILHSNESNSYSYHIANLKYNHELNIKKIDASIVTQKTHQYISILLIIFVFCTTILVFLYKEEFVETWIIVLTSIFGGFGMSNLINSRKTPDTPTKNE